MFIKYNTKCETPECKDRLNPAFTFYHTTWSLIWICEPCFNQYYEATGELKKRQDRALGEHMYDLMMRRSYNYMNDKSGYMLEEMIAQRAKVMHEIETAGDKQRAAERRELRSQINEAKTKVGAPDDEILIARERQDLRAQMGKPILGQQRTDRLAGLRAKLIVRLPIEEKNDDGTPEGA